MSALTDQVDAQANAQAIQVYKTNLAAFEQAIIKDRETIRAFLKDHPQFKEVLTVNDNGMVYVGAKPKKGDEPEVHTNGRAAKRRAAKADKVEAENGS